MNYRHQSFFPLLMSCLRAYDHRMHVAKPIVAVHRCVQYLMSLRESGGWTQMSSASFDYTCILRCTPSQAHAPSGQRAINVLDLQRNSWGFQIVAIESVIELIRPRLIQLRKTKVRAYLVGVVTVDADLVGMTELGANLVRVTRSGRSWRLRLGTSWLGVTRSRPSYSGGQVEITNGWGRPGQD